MAQFGRYFEEFNVGDVYKHWPGRTITESDDILFCMLTMNHHPLHIDANYAKDSDYGRQVVVGNLVVDIAMGQSVPDVSGKALANLGSRRSSSTHPRSTATPSTRSPRCWTRRSRPRGRTGAS